MMIVEGEGGYGEGWEWGRAGAGSHRRFGLMVRSKWVRYGIYMVREILGFD